MNQEPKDQTKKWYKTTGGIIALLIFFFPIGVYLMWKYTGWNKKVKWAITAIFAFILLIIVFSGRSNQNTTSRQSPTPSPTATIQSTVTNEEREIFYKYFEYYWNLPTVPIGDKSRDDKAASLTANAFHIATDEAKLIYEKVLKAKPTEKEIETYETLETRLDEAINDDSSANPFDEKAINNKVAKQYDISTTKLMAIYTLVQSDDEYQKQRESKIAQETKEKQIKAIIEKRKKILDNYIKAINDMGMNQFIESINYKYTDADECSIIVKVRNTWHYQLKQLRLQAAQNLWELWSQSYYLESERDKCRMELVDLNGNNVGGSSWMGGSVINVKD